MAVGVRDVNGAYFIHGDAAWGIETGRAAGAVDGCDLVILCVPVGVCGAIAAEIGPYLTRGAIVSDVGSVKASIVRGRPVASTISRAMLGAWMEGTTEP